MKTSYTKTARITESASICTGSGFLFSILVGTDNTNDPVVAAYDDTDATTAANRIIPSVTYDASVLGLNGVVMQFPKKFTTGLYIAIANIGSGEVVIDYRQENDLFPYKFI